LPTLKSYLNGSLGFSNTKTFKPEPLPPSGLSDDQQWWIQAMKVSGINPAIAARRALGLSNVSNFEKTPRPARGLNGISRHGRRVTECATLWLEQTYGKDQMSFGTFTLPPEYCDRDIPDLVIDKGRWSKAVERTIKAVRYHLEKAGLPEHIVGVTEIQESRYRRTGEVGLHLHLVWVGRKRKGAWALTCKRLRKIWKNVIETVTNTKGICKWDSAVNVQRIKKSAASYLGKYLSKGSAVVSSLKEAGLHSFIPSSWTTITRELLKIYYKTVVTIGADTAYHLLDVLLTRYSSLLAYSKWIKVPSASGEMITVGWYGKLQKDLDRDAVFELLIAAS